MPDDRTPPESNRVTAEKGREDAEDLREEADRGRDTAEEHRVVAESARKDAEQFRVLAEEARHATIAAVAATADVLSANLAQMQFLEDARTTLRTLGLTKPGKLQ